MMNPKSLEHKALPWYQSEYVTIFNVNHLVLKHNILLDGLFMNYSYLQKNKPDIYDKHTIRSN